MDFPRLTHEQFTLVENIFNPYTPNDPRIIELLKKSDAIKIDLANIRDNYQKRMDMLIESQDFHLKSYEMAIQEIKARCTHKFGDGTMAISKTNKSRVDWMDDGTFRSISFCDICGGKFISGQHKVEKKPIMMTQQMIDDAVSYADDLEEVGEMLEFDPNWHPGDLIRTVARITTNLNDEVVHMVDITNDNGVTERVAAYIEVDPQNDIFGFNLVN